MSLVIGGVTIEETNRDAMEFKGISWKDMNISDWLQFTKANRVYGEPGIAYDELRALHEACETLGKRPIRAVETGMCFGTTTRYFLIRTIKYGGELWSYEVKPREIFVNQMKELGLDECWMIKGHSMKDSYDGKRIDVLFIDSEHALQDALGEYMRFRPFFYEYTIIGFHDSDSAPGVKKAIEMVNEVDELELVSESTGRLGMGLKMFKRKQVNRMDRRWNDNKFWEKDEEKKV